MKKANKKAGEQKHGSLSGISVTIDEASLLKNLVEKLAHRRFDTAYTHEAMPAGWEIMETSSIEAYVSGEMNLFGESGPVSKPYATCFSFTCTKSAGQGNTLSWVNSLS